MLTGVVTDLASHAFSARRRALIAGAVGIVLVVGLGLIVGLRASPFGVDTQWMEEIVEHRNNVWLVPSLVMNFLGGGWFGTLLVPIAVTVLLVVLRRPWSALYFLVASAASAVIAQVLKVTIGRARPSDILVQVDPGSFPSGHVANAATIAVAIGFVVGRAWVWVAGVVYVLMMALSRTYLGAHWVSDTMGGALLGAAVSLLLYVAFAPRLGDDSWRRRRKADSVEP